MGVLSNSLSTTKTGAAKYSNVVVDKVTVQLETIKKVIDSYLKYLGEIQIVTSTCELLKSILDQLSNLKVVLWSKEKGYQLWSFLLKQLSILKEVVSGYTAAPLAYANKSLGEVQQWVIDFIVVTFEKLDDSMVTPVYIKTKDTTVTAIESVSNVAHTTIDVTNNKIIKPTTACVNSSIVIPSLSAADSAKTCLLKTSATVDSKMQLSEWLSFALQTSKKYDNMYLNGYVTRKSTDAVDTAVEIDKKYTSGKVTGVVDSTYKEFQMCKQKTNGNSNSKGTVTSAGAPVYV